MIHPLLCMLSLFLVPLALQAQDSLGAEGKAAASALARAGWSQQVESRDVAFTVRRSAVCTPAMREALSHLPSLTPDQQKAFAHWARIEFRRSGWFFKAPVAKGTYDIALGFAHGQPLLLLRQKGVTVGQSPFWFQGEVAAPAAGELLETQGATRLTIRFGNIRLLYRFVPESAHEDQLHKLHVYREGRVTIRSDLQCYRELRALVAWLDRAMVGSERFLGAEVGKQKYELCLFASPEGYRAIDGLMTGGAFARNKAFTSNATRISYLWYHPHSGPEAFVDHGIPMRVRILCLHELQHSLSYRRYPLLIDAIPRWFSEALAERGAHAGLAVVDETAAARMDRRHLDRLAYAAADMGLPPYQDVMDWQTGHGMSDLYSAAWMFSRRGPALDPKTLPDLLRRITEAGFPHESLFVFREAGWDAEAYARMSKLADPQLPLRIRGDYDQVDGSIRIISSKDSEGRILLPSRTGKSKVEVSGSIAWQDLGARQADVYLAYRRGFDSAEFLKLALMPRRVALFWYRSGTWFRVAIRDFDEDLVVSKTAKQDWHRFSVRLDGKTRKIELTLGEARKASFELRGGVDLAGSRVGLGVYDGVAWFRDIRVQ